MVCVVAHVDLGDIFRLVGHHSATPPSLTKPSPVQVQHLQDGTRCLSYWKPGPKILNSSPPSRTRGFSLCVKVSWLFTPISCLSISPSCEIRGSLLEDPISGFIFRSEPAGSGAQRQTPLLRPTAKLHMFSLAI